MSPDATLAKQMPMPEKTDPPYKWNLRATAFIDGVFYASLESGGAIWRVGSTNPDWQTLLSEPRPHEKGVWLRGPLPPDSASINPASLAVMCCGLGSPWPGMGRELYENFPLARQAMEAVADLADWDILALMAENSIEKISQTRWQIPYLFMLEYAQWHIFQSFGIKPTLICGHSLGELVALCLAGVYDLRTAWYLLDTRAEHMAELEAKSERRGGMLAVPAPFEQIKPILEKWPDLHVANRNTPRQYILGGPREPLQEARKLLRRAKIPAILLNMNLAFHNPAMRILREISLLRLNSLQMRPPRFPVLACTDACFYPETQADICQRIADLDETAVDWVASVDTMTNTLGITNFLELGPQETLCGLVSELTPSADCLACDSKGHEAQSMRSALAALFASGFLDLAAIAAQTERSLLPPAVIFAPQTQTETPLSDINSGIQDIIIGLLAETSGKNQEDITPEQDLRRDLGMRSSVFPFLVLEAERRLGKQISLETLAPLATVADAIRFLSGASMAQPAAAPQPTDHFRNKPLLRYVFTDGHIHPAPFAASFLAPINRSTAIACVKTDGLAQGAYDACDNVIDLDWSLLQHGAIELWKQKLAQTRAMAPCGMILELPSGADNDGQLIAACKLFLAAPGTSRWLIILKNMASCQLETWFKTISSQLVDCCFSWRLIARVQDNGRQDSSRNVADMLANEIMRGQGENIVWKQQAELSDALYQPTPNIYPAEVSIKESGTFEGYCQYSRFADPLLSFHGANAPFSPLKQQAASSNFQEAPWLPLSSLIATINSAATMFSPNCILCGLADLRIYHTAALPDGITRLCRLSASARNRFPLHQVQSKLCRVKIDIADLTPTGRQNEEWLPLGEGVSIAARECAHLEDIWPISQSLSKPIAPIFLQHFYEALGFGKAWRLLQRLTLIDENFAKAELRLPEHQSSWSYGLFLEASLQAGLVFNTFFADTVADMAQNLGNWRFGALGLARFCKIPAQTNASLYIKLAWNDSCLRRYEGQIIDSSNRLLLAFHNMEFDFLNGFRAAKDDK